MRLTDKSVKALLEAFRSSSPTPGGGSAAALAGAIGASLLAMVAGLPKPRAANDGELRRLRDAGSHCAALAIELEALVDRDSQAYDQVVAAYRMPKDTDAEKAARTAAIQEGLKAAIEAPLDVMRACSAALEQAAVVARFGNRNASSDVQVALELLAAGLRGARLNVDINLDSVKDADYVSRVRSETERLAIECEREVGGARAALGATG